MTKTKFAFGLILLLALVISVPACPPAGQQHAKNLATKVDVSEARPYSIEGISRSLAKIDAAREEHRLKPLFRKYEEAFKKEPKNPFKRFLWAYAMEDRNQGWQELAKITKLNDKFVWAYLGMGIILDEWKLYDQAEKNFEHALRLGADIPECNGRYGHMLLHKGDYEKAIELLKKAVDKNPGEVLYQLDLARAFAASDQATKAEETYKNAVSADPKSFEALAELGRLLAREKKYQQALDAMSKASELDDKNYEVRFAKAELLSKLDKGELAVAAYDEACSRKPDELTCWKALWKLAGKLGKKDVETRAAEQIIRIDPENIEAHVYLAPVYLAQGAIEKALPSYQLIYSKDKEDVDAMLGLAKIYEQGEQWSKALEFNQKVLEKKPEQAEAKDAMKRLFTRFYILEKPLAGKTPDGVFRVNRIQIAKVYKLRLKKKPGLEGSLLIKVAVDNDGKVHGVTIAKDTLGDQILDLCAVWNLKRSKFPAGFGATYDFELTLRPGS